MSFIKFEKIYKKYKNNIALKDVSFSIEKKEFVTIVGHSGSGKSTLFKLLLGEIFADSGSVQIANIKMEDVWDEELLQIRRITGAIFQDFRLLESKTVYENIAFSMEALGHSDKKIRASVPYVLDLVDMKAKIYEFPSNLSGGEKQRVAIARAIVNQPKILLADEPTGNLDPLNSYEVINILKQINKLGTTVILTTHDRAIVDKLGGRIITLEDGGVVMDSREGKYIFN